MNNLSSSPIREVCEDTNHGVDQTVFQGKVIKD
jgi:hypothetical protein